MNTSSQPAKRGCGTCLLYAVAAIAAFAGLLWASNRFVLRPWYQYWGATDAERVAILPGDEYIVAPAYPVSNKAITINATPEHIWPWLVQLGAEKGGFYSYVAIERLLNCPLVNADRIHPEWQNLSAGDLVKMCPGNFGPAAWTVAAIDPQRALILGHPSTTDAEKASGAWVDTWAFVLEPIDSNTTRLILRSRVGLKAGWRPWFEPGVFIMERGMLRGIRDRAEGQSDPG